MQLRQRFLSFITVASLTASLGLGLFVIVDNVDPTPVRPAVTAMRDGN